jgi:2-dehydro-3-deoxy-D-arabinonate dehydratase
MALWRVRTAEGERLARGPLDAGPVELLQGTLDELLAAGTLDAPVTGPVPQGSVVLAPVAGQEVWAAGVTYAASRTARNDESKGAHDFYDLVYDAERPELFFKALAHQVRGGGESIGIRADSEWSVPEPELALVVSADGRIAGLTIGNDMSSRSIEGANPLYLPQAKVYTGSCALGPCIVPVESLGCDVAELDIQLVVSRSGDTVYEDLVSLSHMRRRPQELVDWLRRALEFPEGVVLLTGTSIVPPLEFTLAPGDVVRITVPQIGVLESSAELVGS